MTNWRIGQAILDEYMIERELGRGGMGRVWLVKSESTGRRFAVKQALIRDEKHRKAFLNELQTWIDLPEHPNIVPCRFFRTVGDEIVIFADYIEGGTLADWISKGKLSSLEQALDVAIQFAWGLHAIHERGLIHQDVKPGNVLMTPDGVPMVTDFGLARSRQRASDSSFASPALPHGQRSVLVSSGGMTPAYASPEQRNGKPLSRKTDIWSWGVSVLDMFMGGVSCPYGGHIAAEVLGSLREEKNADDTLLPLPSTVAKVLQRCFATDLNFRYAKIHLAAEHLVDAYNALFMQKYSRKAVDVASKLLGFLNLKRCDRRQMWKTPGDILVVAKSFLAFDHLLDIPNSASAITPRARAIEHLQQYKEITRNLELTSANRRSANFCLFISDMYANMALVHEFLGDYAGALSCYDLSYKRIDASLASPGDSAVLAQQIFIHCGQAMTLELQGKLSESSNKYTKAIGLLSRIPDDSYWKFSALATCSINNARIIDSAGDTDLACKMFDEAVGTFQNKVNSTNRNEFKLLLGNVFFNWGVVFSKRGQTTEAKGILNVALEYYHACFKGNNAINPICETAACFRELATVYAKEGAMQAALKCAREAIVCLETQVHRNSDPDLRREYAAACIDRAYVVSQIGDLASSIKLYLDGAVWLEQLVNEDGRDEFKPDLAHAHRQIANDYADSGLYADALNHYDIAHDLYLWSVDALGKRDLQGDLGWLKAVRANTLRKYGRTEESLLEAKNATDLLKSEYERTSNPALCNVSEWLFRQFGGSIEL